MLSAYHLGTGACDLSKLFSMLGFGNMLHFERSFYRHEHDINERIIHVTRRTIASALLEEIRMTAEETFSDLIEDRSLQRWFNFLKNKEYDKAKQIITHLRITTSYDMGWQRRSTGRVYDSLSGHGYMVG